MSPRPLLAALILALGACGPAPALRHDLPTPPVPATASGPALQLSGSLGGGLPGVGPSARFELWLRPDGYARVELTPDDQAWPTILLLGPGLALRHDRQRGQLEALADTPGAVELPGVDVPALAFAWLVLGRALDPALAAGLAQVGDEWRASLGELAVRGGSGGPQGVPHWTEIAWRDPEGRVRSVRAELGDFEALEGWGALPTGISVDGQPLDGRVAGRWEIRSLPELDEDFLDPAWEPGEGGAR